MARSSGSIDDKPGLAAPKSRAACTECPAGSIMGGETAGARTGFLVELRGFRTSDLRSTDIRALDGAAASGSGRPTAENAPLDPTLAAVERAVTLSQRFLLAAPERKVIRQPDWTWLKSERHPDRRDFDLNLLAGRRPAGNAEANRRGSRSCASQRGRRFSASCRRQSSSSILTRRLEPRGASCAGNEREDALEFRNSACPCCGEVLRGAWNRRTFLAAAGGSALGLSVARFAHAAEDVPQLPYESVPDPLRLPPDLYLGEVSGVAVNSKGHVFVCSAAIRPARPMARRRRSCSSSTPTATICARSATTSTPGPSPTR